MKPKSKITLSPDWTLTGDSLMPPLQYPQTQKIQQTGRRDPSARTIITSTIAEGMWKIAVTSNERASSPVSPVTTVITGIFIFGQHRFQSFHYYLFDF
jgi:hypothetical protein